MPTLTPPDEAIPISTTDAAVEESTPEAPPAVPAPVPTAENGREENDLILAEAAARQDMDDAVLDRQKYYAGQEISTHPDADALTLTANVDRYIMQRTGRPVPHDPALRDHVRDEMALRDFGKNATGDDRLTHHAMFAQATRRRDRKALCMDLISRARAGAFIRHAGDAGNPFTWPAVLSHARSLPGYMAGDDPMLLDLWLRQSRDAEKAMEDRISGIRGVWRGLSPERREAALGEMLDPDTLLGGFVRDTSTPAMALEAAGKPAATPADDFARLLKDTGHFASYTASHSGAWDKNIWRDADGRWNFPLLSAMSAEGGTGDGIVLTGTALAQKTGGRTTVDGPLAEALDRFQEKWNLTDRDLKRIHRDLGTIHREWKPAEKYRLLSDGTLMPNPLNSAWLDPDKALAMVGSSGASQRSKLHILRNLGEIQLQMAETKLDLYNHAAGAGKVGQLLLSPAMSIADHITGRKRIPTPYEWADEQGLVMDAMDAPAFILSYEAAMAARPGADKWIGGLAADATQSVLKTASSLGGLAGLAGWDAAGEWGAMNSGLSGKIDGGQFDTGLGGKALEESLNILVQIFLTRGAGSLAAGTGRIITGEAAGATAAAVGAGGRTLVGAAERITGHAAAAITAGASSAGQSYSDAIAAIPDQITGAEREKRISTARADAARAGAVTTIVTGIFQAAGGAGLEKLGLRGSGIGDVKFADLMRAMPKEELAKNLGKFVLQYAKDMGAEGAEEGIDTFVSTFLNAKPDTNLADVWQQAWESAKLGAAFGAAGHTVSSLGPSEAAAKPPPLPPAERPRLLTDAEAATLATAGQEREAATPPPSHAPAPPVVRPAYLAAAREDVHTAARAAGLDDASASRAANDAAPQIAAVRSLADSGIGKALPGLRQTLADLPEKIQETPIIGSGGESPGTSQNFHFRESVLATEAFDASSAPIPDEIQEAYQGKIDGWRKKVIEWARSVLPSEVTGTALGTIEIGKKKIRGAFGHGRGPLKILSVPYLPSMLKNGIPFHSEPQADGSVMHNLAHRIDFDGEPYVAILAIEELRGRRFYNHEFTQIKRLEELSHDQAVAAGTTHPTPQTASKILAAKWNVKPSDSNSHVNSTTLDAIADGLSRDLPQVDWRNGTDGVLDAPWAGDPALLPDLLPIAIAGKGTALHGDHRAATFAAATDTQLRALGVADTDIANIRAGLNRSPHHASHAIDAAFARLDPHSESARTAQVEVAAEDVQSSSYDGSGSSAQDPAGLYRRLDQRVPVLEIAEIDLPADEAGRKAFLMDLIRNELAGKTIVNADSGIPIFFNSGRHAMDQAVKGAHSPNVARGLTRLADIVTGAVHVNIKPTAEAAGRSRTKEKKSSRTLDYHYFMMPVRIGSRNYAAWFNARKVPSYKALVFDSFGMTHLEAQQKAPDTRASRSSTREDPGIALLTSASGDISIGEILRRIKGYFTKHLPTAPKVMDPSRSSSYDGSGSNVPTVTRQPDGTFRVDDAEGNEIGTALDADGVQKLVEGMNDSRAGGKTRVRPAVEITPEQRKQVEEAYYQKVLSSRVANTDDVRSLIPGYNEADPLTRDADYHKIASAINHQTIDRLLAETPNGKRVVILAGGAGSGKTTASGINSEGFPMDFAIDTVMGWDGAMEELNNRIERAGREATFLYVFTPFHQSLPRVIDRFIDKDGDPRLVPLATVVDGHINAQQNILNSSNEFVVRIIDNSGGKGEQRIIDKNELQKYDYFREQGRGEIGSGEGGRPDRPNDDRQHQPPSGGERTEGARERARARLLAEGREILRRYQREGKLTQREVDAFLQEGEFAPE